MIDLKEFEDLVKQIDTNRYHINRCISLFEGEPFIASWSIYRCNMSAEEYFNPKNLVVLNSKKNNLEDIKKLIEREKNEQKY